MEAASVAVEDAVGEQLGETIDVYVHVRLLLLGNGPQNVAADQQVARYLGGAHSAAMWIRAEVIGLGS
jgi:hypothetical protein